MEGGLFHAPSREAKDQGEEKRESQSWGAGILRHISFCLSPQLSVGQVPRAPSPPRDSELSGHVRSSPDRRISSLLRSVLLWS